MGKSKVQVIQRVSKEGSWTEIAQRIELGTSDLKIGDEIVFNDTDGNPMTVQVAAINPYGEHQIAFVLKGLLEDYQKMNYSETNAGGWKDSWLRNWLNVDYRGQLPYELRKVIKPRIITQNLNDEGLVRSKDYLWLLSLKEVTNINNQFDANEVHFPLFNKDTDKMNIYFGALSSWWLRTPYDSYCFKTIEPDGDDDYSVIWDSTGVKFGFLI